MHRVESGELAFKKRIPIENNTRSRAEMRKQWKKRHKSLGILAVRPDKGTGGAKSKCPAIEIEEQSKFGLPLERYVWCVWCLLHTYMLDSHL